MCQLLCTVAVNVYNHSIGGVTSPGYVVLSSKNEPVLKKTFYMKFTSKLMIGLQI